MSRDKEYDEYCLKAGIENRNTSTDRLGSSVPAQQQKSYYQNVAQREDMRPPVTPPTPTSPIRAALETMDVRISNLMGVTERLFEKLKPVTSSYPDNHPGEPCAPREGNSSLSIDINAMADRIGAIEIRLQLQLDRLEV